MSILVNENTRLIVQGITGREGSYHASLMKKYGTKVVAGVTPGKGGQEIEEIPVFNSVDEAVKNTDANTSILFVPPRFTKDGILEAINSGIRLIVTLAEGVPVHDMLFAHYYARLNNCILIGPNTPGIISPGKSKVGFMPDNIYKKGNIGIMSRSATLSYEIVNNLSNKGIGQSTVVGVGGDSIPGSSFIDLLPLFKKDSQTDLIIMVGEIGGSDEEIAAKYIKEHIKKPVVAFIAGEAAPEGKVMGHAGAIIGTNGEGSAKYKKEKLLSSSVCIVERLNEIANMVIELLKKKKDKNESL
ncbi:succinate--CoA ligase subunit alpha [Candidatus Atribacteria bacterium MT.SAG.1]|nr:succinate--CoA ligase subunit alpha [Candidatus Atribacteria bacterium MT.SAG.1]